MFFAYILKSEKDGRYYYGMTHDLDERLHYHNSGRVDSTKHRTPLVLHYFETFETKKEAHQRERFFKTLDGHKWLKSNHFI